MLMNNYDENFPLGIIECYIDIPKDNICPLLSHKPFFFPDCHLRYTTGRNQRLTKTTIDVMEAVKYNRATVYQVHRALLWTDKKPIFREAIKTLFDMRLLAKREGNESKGKTIKLILNSIHGKFEQMIRDNKTVILDDNDEIDKLNQNGQVITDITLANGNQCFLDINKKIANNVKDPAHPGAFVFAYVRNIMNRCINAFGGFTDWHNTFAYTDTDSLDVSNAILKILNKKMPEILERMKWVCSR